MAIWNRVGACVGAVLVSLLCGVMPAAAITVDNFEGAQSVFPVGPGASLTSVVSHPSAMGLTRTITAEILDGNAMGLVVNGGILSHSQGSSVKGISTIVWDGDSNPASVNAAGLGGLDLTDDAGTAFRIAVQSFDFPFGRTVTLIFTAYDSRDSSGLRFSRGSIVLDRIVNNETFEIPFSQFTVQGPNGGVDFRYVGALQMVIEGTNPAVDLEIGSITTNGTCTFVPRPAQVIVDECGVCGGDNSSCSDCLGIPNGLALPGTSCVTGESGVCLTGRYDVACACKRLTDPSIESCDALDNDCDGLVDETKDACGVCGGDGNSCLGCIVKDQSETLADLDGLAKRQESMIRRLVPKMLAAGPKNLATKQYAAETLKRAHFLQIENWTDSWRLPRITTTCSNLTMCTNVSVEPILGRYRERATELRDIGRVVAARLKKYKKKKPLAKIEVDSIKKVEKYYLEAMALSTSVPDAQSTCTTFGAADR